MSTFHGKQTPRSFKLTTIKGKEHNMLPSDYVHERIEEMYGPERATIILNQFANAQETVGTETIVGQLCDQSLHPGWYLQICEIDEPFRMERLAIGEYLIGRGEDCNIRLKHNHISRVHCLITIHADGHVALRDLNSTNHVYVDSVQMDPDGRCELQENSRILLGSYTCEMVLVKVPEVQ